jgi:hypothetical protein
MQTVETKVRKLVVRLSLEQRQQLEEVVRSQTTSALIHKRARLLLLSDADHVDGRRPDWQIGEIIGLTEKQVKRIRHKFVQDGLEVTLQRQVRADTGSRKTFDGKAEAQLVTLCCSDPPAGQQRWTLSLLVDELCRLQVVGTVCRETVRQTLKKIASSPGKRNAFASRKKTAPVSLRTWKKS